MNKEQSRLILYQLHLANCALQVASTAEEGKAQGIIKAFLMRKAIGIVKWDVDEFFATETGVRLGVQFGVVSTPKIEQCNSFFYSTRCTGPAGHSLLHQSGSYTRWTDNSEGAKRREDAERVILRNT